MLEVMDQLALVIVSAVVDNVEPVGFFVIRGVGLDDVHGFLETLIPIDLFSAVAKIFLLFELQVAFGLPDGFCCCLYGVEWAVGFAGTDQLFHSFRALS